MEMANELMECLKVTIDRCQKFVDQLETSDSPMTKNQQAWQHGAAISTNDKWDLQKELKAAQQQVSRLTEMNKTLTVDLERAKQQINNLTASLNRQEHQVGGLTVNQQESIDRLLMQYKDKISKLEEEKQQVEYDRGLLKVQLEEAKTSLKTSEELVEQLSQQATGPSVKEKDDTISMLQTQLTMFKEDFEHERKDREKAQGRISELEQQLRDARLAQPNSSPRDMQQRADRRRVAMQNHEQDYLSNMQYGHGYGLRYDNLYPGHQRHNVLVADGPGGDVIDEIEGLKLQLVPETKQRTDPKDVLRCPKCHKPFSHEDQELLLDHMEHCD